MTGILFLTETKKINEKRNEKYLPDFFLRVLHLDSILNIFKKKDDPHSSCIFQVTESEKLG